MSEPSTQARGPVSAPFKRAALTTENAHMCSACSYIFSSTCVTCGVWGLVCEQLYTVL
jgi:hypothetical protein